MARKTLTDKKIADLKPGPARQAIPDPELRGHYVRITPSGGKSFVAVARDPYGKQVWATIGACDHFKIAEARDRARDAIKRIKAGLPAFEPPPPKPESFGAVAGSYLERHVQAKAMRSAAEIERILTVYILPQWKDRDFAGIRRSDVTKLLDIVEDANGPRQADYVLAVVRGVMNWHASRTDYLSPIVRGMRRTDPKGRKRARILNDDEIRTVWTVAEGNGTFGAILRLALLTAQRKRKIAGMKWDDVSVDGVWNIPAEDREKGTGGALVLPKTALEIIRAQKRIGENPYVFAGRGDGHFEGWSPCKRAFDAKVLKAFREVAEKRGDDPDKVKMEPWVVHDLRRTARTLMSRAGVKSEAAERVMGHALPEIEGTYDRHSYRDEKADALKRLAGLIGQILKPPTGRVVSLREAAQ